MRGFFGISCRHKLGRHLFYSYKEKNLEEIQWARNISVIGSIRFWFIMNGLAEIWFRIYEMFSSLGQSGQTLILFG